MQLRIEEMTTEQKLGMLFCARRFKREDIDFIIEMIKKRALGCVQLPANAPDICKEILSAADYPILVINDTEMGFPTSELPKIPLMSLAACDKCWFVSLIIATWQRKLPRKPSRKIWKRRATTYTTSWMNC